jgi:hydrogenase maturation protease
MSASSTDARENTLGITKIIGIGQSLRGDDAAGLAAVSLWQKTYPATAGRTDISVALADLLGIGLLSLLAEASKVVLIDALQSDAEPGTIHILTEDRLDSFQISAKSAHGWGIAETLSLGRALKLTEMPLELTLIGIEAVQMEIGAGLSPQVELALPRVASLIEQIVSGKAG